MHLTIHQTKYRPWLLLLVLARMLALLLLLLLLIVILSPRWIWARLPDLRCSRGSRADTQNAIGGNPSCVAAGGAP